MTPDAQRLHLSADLFTDRIIVNYSFALVPKSAQARLSLGWKQQLRPIR